MPTGMTAWMCAVRVVEFNIEVPNYWLCLPMSDPHLSLYNSFLPKAWMMCKLHVCRTAVLLVVKEKKKKKITASQGFCGFVFGHMSAVLCLVLCPSCWECEERKPSGVAVLPWCFLFRRAYYKFCPNVLFSCHRLLDSSREAACYGVVCLFIFYAK